MSAPLEPSPNQHPGRQNKALERLARALEQAADG